MKSIIFSLLFANGFICFAQTNEMTVPANTNVCMILTEDVSAIKNKIGEAAPIIVSDDVKVDDVVVIKKGTPVHALIASSVTAASHKGNSKKIGELRVELYDVAAVDGTVIKLSDCWIFQTAAQNLNSKGAMLVKGTRKNCSTQEKTKIKKPN